MKTLTNKYAKCASLLIALGLSCALVRAELSLTDQITQAPVFPEPLTWAAAQSPSEAESQALWRAIETFRQEGISGGIPALEAFIRQNPSSGWTPRLRANLAKYYRERGRYTLALEHWEKAWLSTKDATATEIKSVADFTLAHWSQLLASLGRKETLAQLFEQTQGRVLDGGSLQYLFDRSKEGYANMLNKTGRSFRCGTFALQHVASVLNPTNNYFQLSKIPSPEGGFSLLQLREIASTNQLDLVPVRREAGAELVVPSVVHWQQNHYAAIVERNGDVYKIVDPTFGGEMYVPSDIVNAEVSGNFMVPRGELLAGWRKLDEQEAAGIFGMGEDNDIDDEDEEECPKDENANDQPKDPNSPAETEPTKCPPDDDGEDDDKADCPPGEGGDKPEDPDCCGCGMAVWRVSEPYIGLQVIDIPLYYTTSYGNRQTFQLTYKQRNTAPDVNTHLGVGKRWGANFLSYVKVPDAVNAPWVTQIFKPGVGHQKSSSMDETSYTKRVIRSESSGGGTTSVSVEFPKKPATNQYAFRQGYMSGQTNYFLTEKRDKAGRLRWKFNYTTTTNNVVKMNTIEDVDGKVSTLSYTNTSFPNLVTAVEDPYGKKMHLQYDSTGQLTNIIDAAGLTSSFQYDSGGNMTNMITGYGQTSFRYTSASYSYQSGGVTIPIDLGGTNQVNRSIIITEPDGSKQMYLYRDTAHELNPFDSTPLIPRTYPEAEFAKMPQLPDYPWPPYIANQLENDNFMHARNSFHWGKAQFAALGSTFKSSLNFNDLTVRDYKLSRLRHWLHKGTDIHLLGRTLSMQRFPSPDGVTDGQKVWYDHQDKSQAVSEGPVQYLTMTAWREPNGTFQLRHFTRNGEGKITQIITRHETPSGVFWRTNKLEYHGGNKLLMAYYDANGDLYRGFSYTNNLIESITNSLGEVTRYFYDTNNWKIKGIRWPSGLATTNIYYTSGTHNGFLKDRIEVGYRTNSYSYASSWVLTHTNELGLVYTNVWDNLQRLTERRFPDGTNKFFYEKLDMVKTIDRMGYTNLFAYDSVRRLTNHVNERGYTNSYAYCDCGALASKTDALNHTTYFYYDYAGRLTNVVYPPHNGLTLSTTNRYDSMGRLTNMVDSSGASVTNYFNVQGLPSVSSNYFGQVQKIVYDKLDNPVSVINANGVELVQTFDKEGRLLTRTYPDTGVEGYGYTANRTRPTSYTNQVGDVTQYSYDTYLRKTNEVIVGISTNAFWYDAAHNLTKLKDGKDQYTYWTYDVYSRVNIKRDHNNAVVFGYRYNANDWTTHRTNAASQVTAYGYDVGGNLLTIDYPTSTDILYTYNARGRLESMTDAIGVTIYAYTSFGVLEDEDGPWNYDRVSYSYGSNGRRAAMTLQQPNASAWQVGYGYDSANRLEQIVSPAGTFDYVYDPSQPLRIQELALPNGSSITNAYDSVSRLTKTHLRNSGNVLLNRHDYIYNEAHQREKQTFEDGNFTDYTYDAAGQLISAIGKDHASTNRWNEYFGYKYDPAGNLNTRTNTHQLQTFSVNSLNQLTSSGRSNPYTVSGVTSSDATSVTVNDNANSAQAATRYYDGTFARTNITLLNGNNTFVAVATDGVGRSDTNTVTAYLPSSPAYAYDANGNLTSDGTRGFQYDDENQLLQITVTNNWKSNFAYDGHGRRRSRTESVWLNNQWVTTEVTQYVYDDKLVLQERSYSPQISATQLRQSITYTRGLDLSLTLQKVGGIGGLLARADSNGGGHAYYHADGSGNITKMVDESESVVADYHYDPYGNLIAKSGVLAEANTYRFSSKDQHEKSGLTYYLYRYYDSNLQRWINSDPIQEQGGINLFGFSLNNPIGLIDPWGLTGGGTAGSGTPEYWQIMRWLAEEGGEYAVEEATGLPIFDPKDFQKWLKNKKLAQKAACDAYSGQVHHAVSKNVHKKIQECPNLKDKYNPRDERFKTKAKDKAAHNGYDKWQRDTEEQINNWLEDHKNATPEEFENYLKERYSMPDAIERFPMGPDWLLPGVK